MDRHLLDCHSVFYPRLNYNMEDIKYYLMAISRKNKKDIHRFIDKIENQIKLKK